jgi:predicted secreted protein
VSDFHLKTELDGNPDENKQRMAAAFETGLRHCATDPLVRLKMILGETYAARELVVEELRDKLSREGGDVRELAEKMAKDATILLQAVGDVRRAQIDQDLLLDALHPVK